MRGLNSRLQKTTDGGNTWNTIIVSTIGNFNITSIFFIDSLNGWITGFWNSAPQIITGLVYKTSNGGQTWDWQYWANQTALYSVYFISELSGWASGKNGFVIKSTNGGVDWIETSLQTTQNLNSIFFASPQTGWISGVDSLLITSDGGNNWDKVGFGQSVISTKFYDSQLGFAITGYNFLKTVDGGYTWSSDIILSNENEKFTDAEFRLSQNYPNPFNPSTKISWQSPVGALQTLKVYDILSNEVATLVDEYKPAGKYEVEFNTVETRHGMSLPSGVYFYQLKVGDFLTSKKMILIK